MAAPVRLLADARCLLGECPLWDPERERFAWLDLAQGVLHEADLDGRQVERSLPLPTPLGGLVRVPGGLGIVTSEGLVAEDGSPLLAVPPDGEGAHPNDAAVDRSGRLWVATADDAEEAATGRLLRIERDRTGSLGGPMVVGNGPAFSPEGDTVCWCDTLAGRVLAAPLDGSALPRTLHAVPPEQGYPDGLTVSADGSLWVALWNGAAVLRLAPDGRLLERIPVPAPLVTSVAFGGPDLDVLLITTARWELDEGTLARAPRSGGAFVWRGDAVGLAEPVWRPTAGLSRPS